MTELVEEFDVTNSKPKHSVTCTVEDCGRPSHLRGWCNTHYKRWCRTGQAVGPIAPRQRAKGLTCSVVECDRPVRERGWCFTHYTRWYTTGEEPAGPVRPVGFRYPDVGYSAVHMRLVRDAGAASQHACVDCGRQAEDWSYDGMDQDERRDQQRGLWYSLNPDHYGPRCKSCHYRYDRGSGLLDDLEAMDRA